MVFLGAVSAGAEGRVFLLGKVVVVFAFARLVLLSAGCGKLSDLRASDQLFWRDFRHRYGLLLLPRARQIAFQLP